jgi:hypothetical protein
MRQEDQNVLVMDDVGYVADVFYIRPLATVKACYVTYLNGLAYDLRRRGHPVSPQ